MGKLSQPDTDSDTAVRECIDAPSVRSFIMTAGAGSGKTTSLVKALAHILLTKGRELRLNGQRVACITYTEIAVREIRNEVRDDPLVHVSTIHSFLWSLIRPFQQDIRKWVATRIEAKIQELQETLSKPRTQAATKERAQADITRLRGVAEELNRVLKFSYGTGSDYANGVLGHDDVVTMGPAFIQEHVLLQGLLARRYPFILVDESQDTMPSVIQALTAVEARFTGQLCLGLFGDAMQKIYATGIGAIAPGGHWRTITKLENYRCPRSVLAVVNAIRKSGDGLVQVQGSSGRLCLTEGTSNLFVAPTSGSRSDRIADIRRWLAKQNGDPLWVSNGAEADIRQLVIVHRMAAIRLGFENLYAALNDDAPSSIKDGFVDGTAWPLTPYLAAILPLVEAYEGGRHFEVMELLRKHSPRLQALTSAEKDVGAELKRLKEDVEGLVQMCAPASRESIGAVLQYVAAKEICGIGDRLASHLRLRVASGAEDSQEPANNDVVTKEATTIGAYLQTSVAQLRGYRTYIEGESAFATQQGIKGAEFARVLVIIDEEEGRHPQFSYEKLFGIAAPSDTDKKNAAEGKDTVIERTRRLFYVCCSRAKEHLAVVVFASDPGAASKHIAGTGFIAAKYIHVLT